MSGYFGGCVYLDAWILSLHINPFLPIIVEHLSHLTGHLNLDLAWNTTYTEQAFSDHSPSNGQVRPLVFWEYDKKREVKLSTVFPKAKSDRKSSNTLPCKGLRWPYNGKLFLTALYIRQLFTYWFDKKIMFSRKGVLIKILLGRQKDKKGLSKSMFNNNLYKTRHVFCFLYCRYCLILC